MVKASNNAKKIKRAAPLKGFLIAGGSLALLFGVAF